MTYKNLNDATEFETSICWHADFKCAYDAIGKLISFKGRKPKGMLLKGAPGTGKTAVGETYIREEFYTDNPNNTSTMPAIYINVSLYNSPSQLLSAILEELKDVNPDQGTQVQKSKTVIRLFKEKNVQILIIDEFHDLLPKSRILPTSKIYRFLKGFIDSCGVPFLLLGTDDSERFLEVDKQISTRFLPTQDLHAFNCLSEYSSIQFAMIIESLLEKFPRETQGLNFIQVNVDDEGKERIRLKESHNMLYRINLATHGLMRVIVNLLTECIELTQPDQVVDKKILKLAFDNVVNTSCSFNPFDMSNTTARVKSRLAKEGLYNA